MNAMNLIFIREDGSCFAESQAVDQRITFGFIDESDHNNVRWHLLVDGIRVRSLPGRMSRKDAVDAAQNILDRAQGQVTVEIQRW